MIHPIQGQRMQNDSSLDLILIAKEFIEVAEALKKKEQVHADLFKNEIDFLISARDFALGKNSAKGNIPASEAFTMTLKAISFEKLKQSSLDKILNDIINSIGQIQTGSFEHSESLSSFFATLSKVVEIEIQRSHPFNQARFGGGDSYGYFE